MVYQPIVGVEDDGISREAGGAVGASALATYGSSPPSSWEHEEFGPLALAGW
jgi:hypothetical protein